MAASGYNKINVFTLNLAQALHDLENDDLRIYLSNELPLATDTTKADVAEIAGGNGYTAGGITLTNVTLTTSAGKATLDADNITITAVGGSIATFQYVILMNQTSSQRLIAWYDAGAPVEIADGKDFDITFGANGILDIT